ncbi:MAG: hypothetical protein KAS71_05705 [Bacteroidales bacterium]|nr:hypothetical protein [Bacteroidales bacterium]
MKFRIIKISGLLLIVLFTMTNINGQDIQDLVQKCSVTAGSDATYLKDFVVKLNAAGSDNRPPMFRQSLALRKNVTYRFSICNMDNSEGEAIMRVYDQTKLILSTWYPDTGKEFNIINFKCMKSGVYTIVISFKEGKKGEAIGILSYVSK